jgi:hypothetical protein
VLLRRLLPLQIRHMGRLVAHESWIVDRLAVVERSPVAEAELDAAMAVIDTCAGAAILCLGSQNTLPSLP